MKVLYYEHKSFTSVLPSYYIKPHVWSPSLSGLSDRDSFNKDRFDLLYLLPWMEDYDITLDLFNYVV